MFRQSRLLYCSNFEMDDYLTWSDSFCSGSYFHHTTYVEFFFPCQWQTSSSHTSLGGCLEGHSTSVDLANSSYSQGDASLWHSGGMSGLLARVLAGLGVQPAAACGKGQLYHSASSLALLKSSDTCTSSTGKVAWLANCVVRKSRCHKNNLSQDKLSLPLMKLLCVQLPVMYFAVQDLWERSFTLLLTYLYLAVFSIRDGFKTM